MQNKKNSQAKISSGISRQTVQITALIFSLIFFGYFLVSCSQIGEKPENPIKYVPIPANTASNATDSAANANKSLTNTASENLTAIRFPHNNQYHSEVSCLICHQRATNAAHIGFPGRQNHTPCIGCHTQQFSDNKSPFCGICHTNTETGNLRAFPLLRSYGVRFNHAKHAQSGNCAVCHKPASNGVSKTIPGGTGTHAVCFQCHTANSSFRMSSCSVCHQPGGQKRLPASAGKQTYPGNFSHAKHNFNCVTCHSFRGGNQVSAPLISMHLAPKKAFSCATCHNNRRAFGGDDFADCKRCHRGKDFGF